MCGFVYPARDAHRPGLDPGERRGRFPSGDILPMNENELLHEDVRTEYHLTRESWVRGTHRFFGKVSGAESVAHPPAPPHIHARG